MKLKIHRFLLVFLIITGIVLNACGSKLNQSINPTLSPTLATSTPIPATLTLSITPTLTVTPTLTPTDWFIVLLTTTPTMMYPLPTLPPDCGMIKLGKAGTQTIDNKQNILVQGTAILCGQIYDSIMGNITATVLDGLIDLDSGTLSIEKADLWFCPGGGSTIFYYFCHVNNTEVRKYQFLFENGKVKDPEQPSFEECLGTKPYTGINDDEAKYACVVTTLGNISRVKMEQYNPLDNVMSVEISFITWEK